MQRVLVVDKNRESLMPCHPARARALLKQGKAVVFRRYPFTIMLTERAGGEVQQVACKVDPGSQTSGIALVAEGQRGKRVIWAADLTHRGPHIKAALLSRRQLRRSRRRRKTRYRPARFANRRRAEGWLPPSLQSRVENIMTWATRLRRWSPVSNFAVELVRFDTQLMQNAEIAGVEYQQGELVGYEIREYLLEKWGRKCAYCGAADTAIEVEHIVPKSRGGSNRVSNLTLACHTCNTEKGNRTAEEFGFPTIQRRAKQPLKDAAAVNATRWALWRRLEAIGLTVEVGTGGRTKFNRRRQGYPKAHWIDAACVGRSGENIVISHNHEPLVMKATGHQSRQMCRMNQLDFRVPVLNRGVFSSDFRQEIWYGQSYHRAKSKVFMLAAWRCEAQVILTLTLMQAQCRGLPIVTALVCTNPMDTVTRKEFRLPPLLKQGVSGEGFDEKWRSHYRAVSGHVRE